MKFAFHQKYVLTAAKSKLTVIWKDLVRFPDPTYGVGRENEPLRSWEKNFGVTKLKKFQW